MAQVQITKEEFEALLARIETLESAVTSLTAPKNTETKEMTDDHAMRILVGDLKDAKHNEAAKKLGLSYGQIYSCRGEYTFKHIHKKLKARPEGFTNKWVKA